MKERCLACRGRSLDVVDVVDVVEVVEVVEDVEVEVIGVDYDHLVTTYRCRDAGCGASVTTTRRGASGTRSPTTR